MSRRGKREHKPGRIATQLLIAMPVLTILLSLASAKMILSGTVKEEQLSACVYAVVGITAFLVCLYCAIRMPQKKALWGIATAASYAVMLLLGNLLFFGLGFGEVVPSLLVIFASGCIGSFLGAIRRRKYA